MEILPGNYAAVENGKTRNVPSQYIKKTANFLHPKRKPKREKRKKNSCVRVRETKNI